MFAFYICIESQDYLRDGMGGDLVTLAMHFLDCWVVGVLVRHEEGGLDVATIGVLAFTIEDLLVKFDVVVVDGVVEGNGDHLRYVFGWKVSGNLGTVFRAETVWKNADAWVAWGSPVWIVVDVWNKIFL